MKALSSSVRHFVTEPISTLRVAPAIHPFWGGVESSTRAMRSPRTSPRVRAERRCVDTASKDSVLACAHRSKIIPINSTVAPRNGSAHR
jgi:hypothetical protein